MNRQFLTQFLNKISDFPSWVKEIIYVKLSEEINKDSNLAYYFATYKPVLTYKGKCELDFKKSGFDTNIYNILSAADEDSSISDITINTYLSMEEVAGYFLFCVDEGYFEIPDNSQILSIAGFLAGKLRTGEYFMNSGTISESELDSAIRNHENSNEHKKFGQSLIELGLITQRQLETILLIKEEAKKAGAEVIFHGAIYDEAKKLEIMNRCHFGLNIMKSSVCVGLTMKSVDYFRFGLPIINNIPGDTKQLVLEQEIGTQLDADCTEKLLSLTNSDVLLLRANVQRIFTEKFAHSVIKQQYTDVLNRIEGV